MACLFPVPTIHWGITEPQGKWMEEADSHKQKNSITFVSRMEYMNKRCKGGREEFHQL